MTYVATHVVWSLGLPLPGERPKTVLVVDDEDDIRDALLHLIASKWRHLNAVPAASGAAALEIMREVPVDCVVTDYKMPGMTGVELLRQAFDLSPSVQGVMVTAYHPATIDMGVLNGGHEVPVLSKPVDIPAFLRTLERKLYTPT